MFQTCIIRVTDTDTWGGANVHLLIGLTYTHTYEASAGCVHRLYTKAGDMYTEEKMTSLYQAYLKNCYFRA